MKTQFKQRSPKKGTKSYEDGMQQQGKSFYAHDFSIITIPNEENLYQSSALTLINILFYLL